MIRTLIVDDDPDVLRMHRLFVEAAEGFEVAGTLERGAEVQPFLAEAEAQGDPVDLLLLDVHLPDRSGVEVLAGLRAAGYATGVIMITAAAEAEVVRSTLGSGIDDYLVKPFTVVEFSRRLAMFREARIARQNESGATGGDPGAQAKVDALLEHGGAGTAARSAGVSGAAMPGRRPLPKGFSQPTLDLVIGALQRALTDAAAQAADGGEASAGVVLDADAEAGTTTLDGYRSAVDIAEECGISKVSARRYLGLLTQWGWTELRPRYGSAGRPEHRYRWRR